MQLSHFPPPHKTPHAHTLRMVAIKLRIKLKPLKALSSIQIPHYIRGLVTDTHKKTISRALYKFGFLKKQKILIGLS